MRHRNPDIARLEKSWPGRVALGIMAISLYYQLFLVIKFFVLKAYRLLLS